MSASRRLIDIAKRVSDMSAAEVGDRLRQEIGKRLDVVRYRVAGNKTKAELSGHGPAGHFLFSSSEVPAILSAIRSYLPECSAGIAAEAQQICNHEFRLLGYDELQYGAAIDWHLDALHQKSSPRLPWFKVNYFDPNEVGDPKVTWELNRHQHMVVLAKAYRLTGDERFARELFAQWYSWQEQNPYPIGINWASSLEVAFRSMSWLWVWFLLEGSDAVPPSFSVDLLSALDVAGRHIERYLSTYTSPNTHLLGEALGLFFIGGLCPQLWRAPRWQNKGWSIILQEARRQVHPDGFHFEQSTYYHVYALDMFLHARVLAARNQIAIAGWFDETLRKMLDALAILAQSGAPPSFGDDDGGRIFDSRRNGREHLLDPLAVGAVLFDNPQWKALSPALTEEAIWLLGPSAPHRFDALPRVPPLRRSAALTHSGAHVMVNSRGAQLTIDAGPQGAHTAGHGHADALSINVSGDGRELLSDPGTYQYAVDPESRRWFRSTGAHNTVQINGLDQADTKTPFSWANLPTTSVERWIAAENFDVFCGSHDAYRRLPGSVVHQRWVINFKTAGFWLVRDVVSGKGEHAIDVAWHLAPMLSGSTPLYFSPDCRSSIAIIPADRNWTEQVKHEGWSPCYGRKIDSRTLRCRQQASLPVQLGTLLVPSIGANELGSFRRVDIPEVCAYEYLNGDGKHLVVFSPHRRAWSVAGLSSDADLLCCTVSEGQIEALLLCNGTYVEQAGERLLAASRCVGWCELLRRGSCLELSSPDREAITLQSKPEMAETVVGPTGRTDS